MALGGIMSCIKQHRDGVLLGIAFLCWYGFSTLYNIQTKLVLRSQTVSIYLLILTQLTVGWLFSAVCIRVLGLTVSQDETTTPKVGSQFGILGAVHASGSFCTTYSLAQTSVSLVQTIKAAEPIFALGFIRCLTRADLKLTRVKITAMLLVIFGVSTATYKDTDYDLLGVAMAVSSNTSFQLRNVMAKYLFSLHSKNATEKFLQFSRMSKWASLLFFPVWTGHYMWQCHVSHESCILISNVPIAQSILYISMLHFGYQASSFIVLASVTPLTHSVFNVCKRALIITASILVVGNSPSTFSSLGMAMALVGSFLYSLPAWHDEKLKANVPAIIHKVAEADTTLKAEETVNIQQPSIPGT